MKFFNKKETLIENMTFMAIMAIINVIVSLVAGFSVIASLFLIIFLPLVSALTEIVCKDKYYPIYAVVAIGLSIVTTLWNIETTIFYTIPSILTGFIFGFILKHNFKPFYSVVLASLVQAGFVMLSILFINYVLEIDIVNTFKTSLGLIDSPIIAIIFPSAVLLAGFIEMSLAYFVIQAEAVKFGISLKEEGQNYIIPVIAFVSSASLFGLYFLDLTTAYFFMFLSLFVISYVVVLAIVQKDILLLVLYGLYVVITIILYVLFGSKLAPNSGFLLLGSFPLLVSLTNLSYSFLKKKDNKE